MRAPSPIRIAISVLLVGGSLAALTGCAPLSQDELRRQAGTVESVAAEGGLLAHQVAEGETTEPFVRVHGDELAQQLDHSVEKLRETEAENEVPADLRGPLERIVHIAHASSDAIERLTLNPGDSTQADEVAARLQAMGERAGRVADSL